MSNYVKFYLCFGFLCFLFPPLMGLAAGSVVLILMWLFFYYIVLGG